MCCDLIVAELSEDIPPKNLDANQEADAHTDAGSAGRATYSASGSPIWMVSSLFGSFTYERRQYAVRVLGKVQGESGTRVVHEEMTAWYRGPAWLVNRVWSAQVAKASSGWTFSPRVYNVVPNDSLIFEYALQDNLEGLQHLLSTGKATPYVCDEENCTPLPVRLFANQARDMNKTDKTREQLLLIVTTRVSCYYCMAPMRTIGQGA